MPIYTNVKFGTWGLGNIVLNGDTILLDFNECPHQNVATALGHLVRAPRPAGAKAQLAGGIQRQCYVDRYPCV